MSRAVTTSWPAALFIVRHGESAGNVARDAAELSGAEIIDIPLRDVDVELSDLGRQQARALGSWLERQPAQERPTVVLSSPYTRAQQTAKEALRSAGVEDDAVERLHDERLREREFGILDRLTRNGIRARQPEQAAIRAFLGKFYHRPPGGESWADVGLRVRNVVDMVCREFPDERVLLVTHEVVVLMFRYVLQALTEAEVLALSHEDPIAHCSVTTFRYDPEVGRRGGMRLESANVVEPLVEEGTPVTTHDDASAAASR